MFVCYDNNARYSTQNSGSGTLVSSSSSSSLCFLPTAMRNYYRKPDDWDELNELRRFRDNWMSQNEDGKLLVSEYYEIDPDIVCRRSGGSCNEP